MAEDLIGKAVIWGPPIVGAVILGPLGVALGVAATTAMLGSGGSSDGSASHGSDQELKYKD
jgi:hypothetical protein